MKALISIILIVVVAFLGYLIYQKYYGKPTATSAVDESGIPSDSGQATGGEPGKERPKFAQTNAQYYIWRVQDLWQTDFAQDALVTAKDIINNNDYDRAVNLLPTIGKCESAFAEMKKAIAAKENFEAEDYRPERPVPNFLINLNFLRLLMVKGMALEKQGNIQGALDAYLLGAQYGGIFAGKNCTLIAKLIGIACEKIAYNRLKQFVINHPQDSENMKRIIKRLEKIEQNRIPVSEGFKSEKKMREYVLDNYKKYAAEDTVLAKLTEADVQQIRIYGDKLWGLLITAVESPYPQYKQRDFEAEIDELLKTAPPIVKVAIPNFMTANVRELVSATDNRLIRVMAAAQLYYADNNKYPSMITELVPNYLTSFPKDYFSDANFVYFTVPASNTFYVYSVGPDMVDNKNQVPYDPTNGTVSAGDIRGK